MRIAILGATRIPAAEQLAGRLTERGHEVAVYPRSRVVDGRRMDFVHTFLGALHCSRRVKPDVALFFVAGNSPLCLITRGHGIPTVINVDGLESQGSTWPRLAKVYLRFAERNAPRWADTALTHSHTVAERFERRYGRRIGVVPYDEYERLLESVIARAGPGSLPVELLDAPTAPGTPQPEGARRPRPT